jgi:hypothetical protein
MSTTEFKQSLRTLSIKELTDKVDYYSSFEPRGVNYQAMLDMYNAEMERRILNWEVTEV